MITAIKKKKKKPAWPMATGEKYLRSPYTKRKVKLEDLKVDRKYQRKFTYIIRRILLNFCLEASGCVICSERSNGDLYIIDGANRVESWKKMGFVYADVYVLKSTRLKESRIFNFFNDCCKKLTPMENFKSALEAKNKDAVVINKIVLDAGFIIDPDRPQSGSKWPYLYCISALNTCYDKSPENFKLTLALAADTWKGQDSVCKQFIISGLFRFVCKLQNRMTPKVYDDMRKKLAKKATYDIAETAEYEHKRKGNSGFSKGKAVYAILADTWNLNLRDKSLKVNPMEF